MTTFEKSTYYSLITCDLCNIYPAKSWYL